MEDIDKCIIYHNWWKSLVIISCILKHWSTCIKLCAYNGWKCLKSIIRQTLNMKVAHHLHHPHLTHRPLSHPQAAGINSYFMSPIRRPNNIEQPKPAQTRLEVNFDRHFHIILCHFAISLCIFNYQLSWSAEVHIVRSTVRRNRIAVFESSFEVWPRSGLAKTYCLFHAIYSVCKQF